MRWLITPFLLLQVGCTLINTKPKSISPHDWNVLQPQLDTAPTSVAKALKEEAQIRVVYSEEAPFPTSTSYSHTTLGELIRYSHLDELKPDAEFQQYSKAITGNSAPDQALFSDSLSHFLLTPGYTERHPAYARYFQQRYKTEADTAKKAPVPFRLLTRNAKPKLIWIDPNRVRSIHLLFAGEGEHAASKYGHVALRLIISPEEHPLDDEAANRNLNEHLVLGFMARIDEFELSTFSALKGDYQAHLLASPFMDTYRNYAIDEFRYIYSLPLQLSQSQCEQMTRELSEIHWSFSAPYRFFGGNCSTLLQQTLRVLLPEYSNHKKLAKTYIRPNRYFSAIRETPLIDSTDFGHLRRAERNGHYFPSTQPYYKKALDVINASYGIPIAEDLETYAQRHPLERMKIIVNNPDYFTVLMNDDYILEAQILLEEYALTKNDRLLALEAGRFYRDIADHPPSTEEVDKLSSEQKLIFETRILQPIRWTQTPIAHYTGIPTNPANPQPVKPQPNMYNLMSEILTQIHIKSLKQWNRLNIASKITDETTENILTLKGLRNES